GEQSAAQFGHLRFEFRGDVRKSHVATEPQARFAPAFLPAFSLPSFGKKGEPEARELAIARSPALSLRSGNGLLGRVSSTIFPSRPLNPTPSTRPAAHRPIARCCLLRDRRRDRRWLRVP